MKSYLYIILAATLALFLYGCQNTGQALAPLKNSCFDTDGGINPNVYGTAYGMANRYGYNYSDSCLDSRTVKEQYCSGTSALSTNVSCSNVTVCRNGACSPPICGNLIIEGNEQCDGTNLGGATCKSLGNAHGVLACTSNCKFNTAGCYNQTGNQTNQTNATYCGDGIVQKPNSKGLYEQCDGANLGGATCQALGFTAGTLKCSQTCTFDTTGCYNNQTNQTNTTNQVNIVADGGSLYYYNQRGVADINPRPGDVVIPVLNVVNSGDIAIDLSTFSVFVTQSNTDKNTVNLCQPNTKLLQPHTRGPCMTYDNNSTYNLSSGYVLAPGVNTFSFWADFYNAVKETNENDNRYAYIVLANATNQTNQTIDNIPPIISIATPQNGVNVTGNVTITATATDNVGVVGVQFYIDNVTLGAEDMTSPYSIAWNTISYTNGWKEVVARARDAAGNMANSTINVFVIN